MRFLQVSSFLSLLLPVVLVSISFSLFLRRDVELDPLTSSSPPTNLTLLRYPDRLREERVMGNSIFKFLCGKFHGGGEGSQPLGPHGVTDVTVGVSALAHDIFHFEITSQVPEQLSQYVVSSKKAQSNWYKKLLDAWREAKPPPKTPEEVSRLVIQTLKRHQKADVEGLLAFYGLPLPHTLSEAPAAPSSRPEGYKYELKTLPVDAKAVADGDTITVYVDTADPGESGNVPREVHKASVERAKARARKDYNKADALHKVIVDAGYRVISGPNNEETLAKKYRIRLRGIDAPESSMPYGKEAKEELVKMVQGKRLNVYVFGDDRYGRCVGDIYCNGVYIQEKMLKGGFAWHYAAYDKRPELAKWEEEARAARVGLWASSHPEKPWEWRKERRSGK